MKPHRPSFSLAFLALACGLMPGAVGEDSGAFTEKGYRVPQPGHVFSFPEDHGNHPGFAIEWWYVTGHLETGAVEERRRFGYQLTFFRLAQAPPGESTSESGAFQAGHIHMAHAAVTDLSGEKFHHEERLNREGWDASAKVGDLDLRNGNWRLRRSGDNLLKLTASVRSEVHLELELRAAKEPVIFGEDGVSRKGADATAASYYITFTRLASEGTLRIGGKEFVVSGESWMDHEISSSQLGADQVGWDWVSIQLDDGREIMAYLLRREDGGYDPISKLTWIGRDGALTAVEFGDFSWQAESRWTSPQTGAAYPIAPTITTTDPDNGHQLSLRIRPLMRHQEVDGKLSGMAYWEGACEVLDERGTVIGKAYLELAGYTPGLRERLRPQ